MSAEHGQVIGKAEEIKQAIVTSGAEIIAEVAQDPIYDGRKNIAYNGTVFQVDWKGVDQVGLFDHVSPINKRGEVFTSFERTGPGSFDTFRIEPIQLQKGE